MKIVVGVEILLLIVITLFVTLETELSESVQDIVGPVTHFYVPWDTREFDKTVSARLILPFVNPDADFVIHPQ